MQQCQRSRRMSHRKCPLPIRHQRCSRRFKHMIHGSLAGALKEPLQVPISDPSQELQSSLARDVVNSLSQKTLTGAIIKRPRKSQHWICPRNSRRSNRKNQLKLLCPTHHKNLHISRSKSRRKFLRLIRRRSHPVNHHKCSGIFRHPIITRTLTGVIARSIAELYCCLVGRTFANAPASAVTILTSDPSQKRTGAITLKLSHI